MGEIERLVQRIEAGETGRRIEDDILAFLFGAEQPPDAWWNVRRAVNEQSIDAAVALAESALPGFDWNLEKWSTASKHTHYKYRLFHKGELEEKGAASTPAAAVVMTTLRAKLAKLAEPAS